mgnify:FL=1
MLRDIDMSQVSDGRLYSSRDMVKAGCDDCKGCSACCRGMGSSIVLDPYDIYMLTAGLEQSFEQLLGYAIELNLVDGIILPNLKMQGEKEACPFLNEEERCSIHRFRPGFCRMFPLGRIYGEGGFSYFLQVHECKKQPKTKVKINKWLGIPNLKVYEAYINQWHTFLKGVEKILKSFQEQASVKNSTMYLLKTFFLEPYQRDRDFYPQFEERMKKAEGYFF